MNETIEPTRQSPRLVSGLAGVAVASCCVAAAAPAAAQQSSLLHATPAVSSAAGPAQADRHGGVPPRGAAAPGTGGSGLMRQPGTAVPPPATLQSASWTYRPEPAMRTFSKNDIVTIRVDEIARVLAEGEAESRKRTIYEAILTDWIRIVHGEIQPDPQPNGDPTVAGESNNQFRSEATVESRESLTFNIAAEVVDIRPNGNLVLEARKSFRVNDNMWETALTGICRVEDIGPDNVVLSRDLIDLQINKQDRGHLRDGYRRGWFRRWFDRLQPF